jgi:hypothetical protein
MRGWCFNCWQVFLLIIWAIWWGGLSFYAIFVVPTGTGLIGSVEQGIITQGVTRWHNILSAGFLVCLVVEAIRARSPVLWFFGIALAIIEMALISWHAQLTQMIDFTDHSVSSGFYSQHAIYLWLTALEWFLGIALIVWLRNCPRSHKMKGFEERNSSQTPAT